MKFLILSWRDIKSPAAGGAEVVIHEIGRRWVEWGHNVTVFASGYRGCLKEEVVDGVKIIRSGNPITVYFRARRYYKKYFQGKYDVVIEEVNGPMPWYSYYYVKEPLFALIHQNSRDFDEFNLKNSVAYYELPPIIRYIQYIIDPYILRYYKRFPILVMSESTKKDFIDLHFSPDNIRVIPEGINIPPVEKIGRKEKTPTFIYLGRLKRSKRVDHIVKAIKIVKAQYPNVRLLVIGRGPASYKAYLKRLATELNLTANITFFGYLSEVEKNSFLQKSHALLITSIREGWGLVVTEANAMGTPAIGYNVAGLRDSIRNGKTGMLVESGNIEALGKTIIKFIREQELQKALTHNAWEWSKEFGWDRSAKVCLERVNDLLSGLPVK